MALKAELHCHIEGAAAPELVIRQAQKYGKDASPYIRDGSFVWHDFTSFLAAYDFRRRPDILARSGAVNLLNMSLLSDFLPAQVARGAGLALLGGLPPLRAFFMREGLHPGSGFAALVGGLREKVRRQDAVADQVEQPGHGRH